MAGVNRSYVAFTRNVRERFGVTQAQARKAYFAARERFGRTPRGTDVGRHPRITKKLVEAVKPKKKTGGGIKKPPPKKAPPPTVPIAPPPPAPVEYLVSADYRRGRRGGHAVSTQISIFVDGGIKVTKGMLQDAIRKYAKTGESPKGFEVVPVFWQHPGKQTEVSPDEEKSFRDVLSRSDLTEIRKG